MSTRSAGVDVARTVRSSADVEFDSIGHSNDAFPVLALFLVLLSVIPAALVVPGLGAAGRPAGLIGLAMLGWWLVTRLLPPTEPSAFIAIRWALFLYIMIFVASMIAGLDRGLDGLESLSMYRNLLVNLSFVGVVLVILDGLRTRASVERLLRWVVALGVVGAVVGVIQFQFEYDIAQSVRLPGLVENNDTGGIGQRGSGFTRVRGFAQHPIEFGVVLAMLLPIALELAQRSETRSWKRWIGPSILAAAIPMSISRSAVLALAVGMAVYAIGLTWRQRFGFGVAAVGLMAALQAVTPGLLGTLRVLFTNLENDNSVTGRTEDFSATSAFIEERPWLGRGPGTFVIERYRTLDNEYLGTVLTTGYLGLASLVFVLICSGSTAIWLVRNARDDRVRTLSWALGADIAISVVVFATFDSLSFPIYAGTLFVVIGCLAALYRLEKLSRINPLDLADQKLDSTVDRVDLERNR